MPCAWPRGPAQNPKDRLCRFGGLQGGRLRSRACEAWSRAPPGAEKPPSLLPAASTRWQGTMSGTGLRAMAGRRRGRLRGRRRGRGRARRRWWSGRSRPRGRRRRSRRKKSSWSERSTRNAGEIRGFAGEVALHGGDGFGDLGRRRRRARRREGGGGAGARWRRGWRPATGSG